MSTDRADGAEAFELVGPFEEWRVVLEGREVPFLTAWPANGGVIHLTLDRRYGLDVAVADAERLIPFLADCIAVGMGYACHQRADQDEPIRLPPFPRLTGIELGGPDV